MRSALLCAYSAEKLFLISRLSRSAERSKRIFTGGVIEGNGICSTAFCESAALRACLLPLGGAVKRSETEGGTPAAESAAKTDPAAAARQQQYQTEITAALRTGDYQRALTLFKEFGNPNLRALNDFQTLKAFGDYAAAMGYDVSPEDISTDETLAAFEESYRNAIENAAKDGIIKSTEKMLLHLIQQQTLWQTFLARVRILIRKKSHDSDNC